ncbi:hypothetical protein [Streptomyces anthocyanicus]|uniref:hypothetical protein n=1 Tax=Streptomyces anthocyanicus TaxID=68174 RepID=UPI00362C054A
MPLTLVVAGEGGDGAAPQVRGADVAGQLDQRTEQRGRTAGRRRDGITRRPGAGTPGPARGQRSGLRPRTGWLKHSRPATSKRRPAATRPKSPCRKVVDVQVNNPRGRLRPPRTMIGPVFGGETVRRLGLTAAVVTILAVTSCSGSQDGDDAAAKPAKSEAASASPAARQSKPLERNLQQVESDVQFAVAPGNLRMQPHRSGFCIVHGTVATRNVLSEAEFEAIVARMQDREWPLKGSVKHSDDATYGKMSLAFLKSGEWKITMGSSAVPAELKEAYAPNEGAITVSISWNCNND